VYPKTLFIDRDHDRFLVMELFHHTVCYAGIMPKYSRQIITYNSIWLRCFCPSIKREFDSGAVNMSRS